MGAQTHGHETPGFTTTCLAARALLLRWPVFIAHLPAGYLLTKRIEAGWRTSRLMPLGLAASVLPDLDLIRFYVVDHRQVLHHEYWTHVPFWWVTIGVAWYLGLAALRRRLAGARSAAFFGNIFLHLALDTVVGGVAWLAPFSGHVSTLVTVPAGHRWWVSNFVLHWTFVIELIVVARALVEFGRRSGDLRCEATPW